jgi:CRP-like cAMP-binding protein
MLIEKQPVLQQFSESDRRALLSAAIRRRYGKGELVAHYGESWPFIFLVECGQIDVLKYSPEGRNLGALGMTEGELFWSPSFFDEGPLPATLEAKADSRLYLWERKSFLPLLKNNPKVLWMWMMMLVGRIRLASEFIEELAFYPLAGRLAKLLLEQFEERDDVRVSREFTLDEMSAKINTSPVMVCKLLSRFADEGLIKVSRTSFELVDRSALKEVCGPRAYPKS